LSGHSVSLPADRPKKLRVAVLMTEAFGSHGGVQLVNRNVTKSLANHPRLEGEYFSLGDTAGDPQYTGGQVFHGYNGNRVALVTQASRAFLTRRYDLLFVTHRNLFPLALAWKAITKRPYLLFAHGVEIWDRQDGSYLKALRGADLLLANSQFTRAKVSLANDLPLERIGVIPLCADALAPVVDSHFRIPEEQTLLTVGRTVRQNKGQDVAICAMPRILAAFPNTRYIIAGGGRDLGRLRQMTRSLGVEQQVRFWGYVSDREKDELYRRATLFIMPSSGEGFGLVYLEAMQYGIPCVAGDGDGAREVVHDGINGLTVDPSSLDAVAAAVVRLLGDPALCESMGAAGRHLVDSRFSFPQFESMLCAILEQTALQGAAR
jgi:phosphatidylinositol alpha-1,6-mannosyltransferase